MSNLRRQGAWAMVDQVLSSGTNFVPSLLMARVLGPRDYGTFALAFLAWFGVLGVLISALMQPYTLAASASEGEDWRAITRSAGGAVILAGATCAGVFAATGLVIGPSSALGRCFLVIALLAPGLALQEFWRFASFAAQRARTAAANDGYWAIAQIVAFGALFSINHDPTAPQCLFAWGIGASLAAGIGVLQLSVRPKVGPAAVQWARKWGRIGAWFTLATACFSLSMLGVAVIIGAHFDRAAVGLFRTVQLLFGPVQLFTIAASSVFMPYLVRTSKTTTRSGLRLVTRYSLLMTGVVSAYGLILLVAAHYVLVTFFGSAFGAADTLVLPIFLSFAIDAASSAADAQLRVHKMGRRIAEVALAASAARLLAVAVLAGVGGFRGAAWGLVVGSVVAAVAYWSQVLITNSKAGEDLQGSSVGAGVTAL